MDRKCCPEKSSLSRTKWNGILLFKEVAKVRLVNFLSMGLVSQNKIECEFFILFKTTFSCITKMKQHAKLRLAMV